MFEFFLVNDVQREKGEMEADEPLWGQLKGLAGRKKTSGVPVDAATAPISTGGIPRTMTTPAAMKQIILAVAVELEESVLW